MSTPSGREGPGDRLESWKEIAANLGREVRTVQLWEKSEGLPVHRHQHSRQGSVYAFRSELDAWLAARRETAESPPRAEPKSTRRFARFALVAAVALCTLVLTADLVARFRRQPAALDGVSSIAVLPFLDLSPQRDQEYFTDGLSEEIIDALAHLPNLRVVARTSAFAFKGKATDVREIGRRLNVATVLEGSVRKSGDQLRITAQLNRVADGYHLWSRTFDRPLQDIFRVQRDISEAIAEELRAGRVPRREQPRDLEAWRLYQEGRYFFNQFQPPDSDEKAIARFQQAIQRDPNFAAAYAGMANAYAYLAENFVRAPREVMPKALEAAQKAVDLDDSSSDAHTALGAIKLDYERDIEGAQRELIRATQLNPGSAYTRHWYAHSLEAQGRLEEAMKEMRAALELDPLSIPINWDIGGELLAARRPAEALAHLRKASELFPQIPILGYLEAEAYFQQGDLASAHRTVEALRAANPALASDPGFIGLFGVDAARQGHPAEARRALARLESMRAAQYVEPFMVLQLCGVLDDKKQLETWLQRADQERSAFFVYLPIYKTVFGLAP